MSDNTLLNLSNQIADAVAAIAPSVVQVHGRRRPASGVVYANDVVLTTMRALKSEDGLHVRTSDGRTLDAELIGWDPATGLAVVRANELNATPLAQASAPARVGNLAIAVARSWSNGVTASAGLVSIIGGPLATGRRRSIPEVIRTTAPMHDGFTGGAFADVSGHALGITTAAEIRGLRVVIPASIAWQTAATLLQHGRLKRGYLGLAGQPVALSDRQRGADGPEQALLIVGVSPDSPAEEAGILVGDILVEFDGHRLESPEDLLDLLLGDRVGRQVPLRVLRGGASQTLAVTVGERKM